MAGDVVTMLCVGGPKDGCRVSVERGRTQYIFAYVRPLEIVWAPAEPMNYTTMERLVYVPQIWRGAVRDAIVLVPEGQSADVTMEMFLARYPANVMQPTQQGSVRRG